jgi:hypothetical protein
MNLYWGSDTFLDEATNMLSDTILSEATGQYIINFYLRNYILI